MPTASLAAAVPIVTFYLDFPYSPSYPLYLPRRNPRSTASAVVVLGHRGRHGREVTGAEGFGRHHRNHESYGQASSRRPLVKLQLRGRLGQSPRLDQPFPSGHSASTEGLSTDFQHDGYHKGARLI